MNIRKQHGYNSYAFEGLTVGKLLTIKRALEFYCKERNSPVGEDVLLFLEREKIDELSEN